MAKTLTINLKNIPSDPLKSREFILSKTGGFALYKSRNYITEEYNNYDILRHAIDFFTDDLIDAAPSDVDSFIKLNRFPWLEASDEIEKALSLIMLSFYKNSFDSMRRALELVIVGSYFILGSVEAEEAREWIKSNKKTPKFRQYIERLIKYDPYLICESEYQFKEFILDLYYRLSDYVHVKGMEKSNRKLSPSMNYLNGVNGLVFHEQSCKTSLDLFIETVQAISLICVLTIPRLLIRFDLDSKFGLNPPLSGFFTPDQAERIHLLIPDRFRQFIDVLEKNDVGIHSIKDWFNNMPDISEEEFSQQCKEFNRLHNITPEKG